MNQWTPKWPTKPGDYWFHGFVYTSNSVRSSKTHLVEVYCLNGVWCYSTNGILMQQRGEFAAHGVWSEANVPAPVETWRNIK